MKKLIFRVLLLALTIFIVGGSIERTLAEPLNKSNLVRPTRSIMNEIISHMFFGDGQMGVPFVETTITKNPDDAMEYKGGFRISFKLPRIFKRKRVNEQQQQQQQQQLSTTEYPLIQSQSQSQFTGVGSPQTNFYQQIFQPQFQSTQNPSQFYQQPQQQLQPTTTNSHTYQNQPQPQPTFNSQQEQKESSPIQPDIDTQNNNYDYSEKITEQETDYSEPTQNIQDDQNDFNQTQWNSNQYQNSNQINQNQNQGQNVSPNQNPSPTQSSYFNSEFQNQNTFSNQNLNPTSSSFSSQTSYSNPNYQNPNSNFNPNQNFYSTSNYQQQNSNSFSNNQNFIFQNQNQNHQYQTLNFNQYQNSYQNPIQTYQNVNNGAGIPKKLPTPLIAVPNKNDLKSSHSKNSNKGATFKSFELDSPPMENFGADVYTSDRTSLIGKLSSYLIKFLPGMSDTSSDMNDSYMNHPIIHGGLSGGRRRSLK